MKNIAIKDRIRGKKIDIEDYFYNKIKQFISNNDVEITTFISAFFIVYASFLVNRILGLYIIGILLAALAVFLIKFPKNKDG